MKWEEEFALRQRKVCIDPYIIKNAMITAASELNSYFKKYEIGSQVTSDGTSPIMIGGLKNIIIERRGSIYVIKSSLEEDEMYAEIEAVNGMFEISYYSTTTKKINVFNLTDKIINKVIGNVIFQQEKEIIEEIY